VHGAPKRGKTLLLFEDDVVALARYLVEGELVVTDDAGEPVNGPAFFWELARRSRQKRSAT
jgi:hypothetical protein